MVEQPVNDGLLAASMRRFTVRALTASSAAANAAIRDNRLMLLKNPECDMAQPGIWSSNSVLWKILAAAVAIWPYPNAVVPA